MFAVPWTESDLRANIYLPHNSDRNPPHVGRQSVCRDVVSTDSCCLEQLLKALSRCTKQYCILCVYATLCDHHGLLWIRKSHDHSIDLLYRYCHNHCTQFQVSMKYCLVSSLSKLKAGVIIVYQHYFDFKIYLKVDYFCFRFCKGKGHVPFKCPSDKVLNICTEVFFSCNIWEYKKSVV